MAKAEEFKNIGSTVQSTGECGREVEKRRISGVIRVRQLPARVIGKVTRGQWD